ncbi:MAG: hypothetical protein WD895_03620 [Acidimicrobiia bacterium]
MTTSTGDGHIHFFLTKPFGRWSVTSVVVFGVGLLAMQFAVALGKEGGETFFDNWWLSGPAFVAGAAAFSALVSGVVAMIREHDRSIGVILSTLLGLLVAFFITGEILAAH